MSRIAQRNKLIKSLLLKAGFTIEGIENHPLKSAVQSLHRHLCGIRLWDAAQRIQVGLGASLEEAERNAEVAGFPVLLELAKTPDVGNRCVWILGPGAKYIARGYGFHLGQLVSAVEAEQAKVAEKEA